MVLLRKYHYIFPVMVGLHGIWIIIFGSYTPNLIWASAYLVNFILAAGVSFFLEKLFKRIDGNLSA
jgi:hypothetical protein